MGAQDEFLMQRQKYIGGSDVAAILGVSPYKNAVDLWLDKITPPKEDGRNRQAKARGSRMEPYIVDMIREEHGLTVVKRGERYIDTELSFLASEIDFEYIEEDGSKQNGEIKTVHPFKKKEWGEELTDSLPLHYVAQVQHGMGVTGRKRCRLFALIGDELKPYVIDRDDELISVMRDRCAAFWSDYVLPKVQPPLDFKQPESVLETLKRLYPGTDGTVIDANPMDEHWRMVLEEAKEMQKHYENIVAGARAHILSRMGNSAALLFNDGQAFLRKLIKKKSYTVEFPETTYIDFRLGKIKEK
ncbi:MAG: endonuclease [Pusillimonas sp.]|nr:endonuclease [Pusillimonas sp.]MBC42813.1 endonuclease [Pusillimonas sp.]HCP78619.1 endonuclease [Pusillimonas sp.]|tara:strand:+ start:506 stop:1408 length:903 start_codon:yes stop_codon:yes gene_type:complete